MDRSLARQQKNNERRVRRVRLGGISRKQLGSLSVSDMAVGRQGGVSPEPRHRICATSVALVGRGVLGVVEPVCRWWYGLAFTRHSDLKYIHELFLGRLPSCPAAQTSSPVSVLVTSHQAGLVWVSMAPSRRHRRRSHGTAAVISLPR